MIINRDHNIFIIKIQKRTIYKKICHMYDFGLKFKEINKQINSIYIAYGESKDKQIAMILKLIMDCNFRVGNEKYCRENVIFWSLLYKRNI